MVAAGSLGVNAAAMSGALTLDDVSAAGSMSGLILPAWMSGKAVGEWFQISGTELAGSAGAPGSTSGDTASSAAKRVYAYCGMAVKDSELWLLANGGHNDYSGNEVSSIDLAQDTPAWELRASKSPTPAADVRYYADGKPSARHTYWYNHWVPQRNRLMMFGNRFAWGTPVSFSDQVDGFNPDTDTWDAEGTWAAGSGYCTCVDPTTGNAYAGGTSLVKWTQATDSWGTVATYGSSQVYGQLAFDATRNQLFNLAIGDAFGYGGGVVTAYKIDPSTGARTAITFNASAGKTAFDALAAANGALTPALSYNADLDVFYYYNGWGASNRARIFVITPNSGAVWDIAVLPVSGVTPVESLNGVMNKFQYVSALRGCVLLAQGVQDIYFIRTS